MEIDHILKLARLEVSKEEKQHLEKDFSSILEFVKTLDEVKINKEELKKQKGGFKNVMRKDETKLKVKNEKLKMSEKLIKSAPETKDGYIKTKQIL
ncbi:MAG TPA: Asp-tRNA(Asn)/Glu-tRNA(Gln) amidotransferase subunit GatC [Candidatus Pacearchaeota archaeon]|nr:Asp-tRNA(Asn)/Glu-tRNA(Gln) amidotransferase subunit GatC [Candidatus Pacearchaeota archaeon]HOK94108.1 Asp-tRNA(Asn)/Glu-tRNA(Gln) amidotransferase subunit GatC [Candidatus Pacearchaeota archaeon]HPO75236.1 Asp-tRNA(Asn)/Glu-tRNA(Gln) amidotransferase subunit GatC [Candidatus Pacearchaeota archaeon]